MLQGPDDLNGLLVKQGPEALAQQVSALFETATLESTSDLPYIRETWLAVLHGRVNRPHMRYTTGLEALDALLGGGYLEGLHLIRGITGGGKTSFALHLAMHKALEGCPVIYTSYEQSRLELWGRIAEGGDALSRQTSAYTIDVLATTAQTIADERVSRR